MPIDNTSSPKLYCLGLQDQNVRMLRKIEKQNIHWALVGFKQH